MLEPGRPRHEQVSDWLRAQIEAGHFPPEAQLPSESRLGAQFGVSRITVRRALQTLEAEGRIYRRQGLGSFVRPEPVRQGLVRLTDFVEDMAQAGLEATSRVLHYGPEAPPSAVAAALSLPPGTRAFRLDRLRLGDGAPMAFDRTWLPAFYAGLLDGHDLERETLYRILERDYQIPVVRGHYRLEAINADAPTARALAVAPGTALLRIHRRSVTRDDRPVYYQIRDYRTDRVAYELALERDPARPHTGGLQAFEPVFLRGEDGP